METLSLCWCATAAARETRVMMRLPVRPLSRAGFLPLAQCDAPHRVACVREASRQLARKPPLLLPPMHRAMSMRRCLCTAAGVCLAGGGGAPGEFLPLPLSEQFPRPRGGWRQAPSWTPKTLVAWGPALQLQTHATPLPQCMKPAPMGTRARELSRALRLRARGAWLAQRGSPAAAGMRARQPGRALSLRLRMVAPARDGSPAATEQRTHRNNRQRAGSRTRCMRRGWTGLPHRRPPTMRQAWTEARMAVRETGVLAPGLRRLLQLLRLIQGMT